MIRIFRCMHAVIWFGLSFGCYDHLDTCEKVKTETSVEVCQNDN